jgi:sirohydrochlorin cobaltochelatase
LILVGHGSVRCPDPGQQLECHAEALARRGLFAEVRTATLFGGPPPSEALRAIVSGSVYVLPMFMCNGQYVQDKVPEAFARSAATARSNGRRMHLCPPIGLDPGLARLIARRAAERMAERGISAGDATLLLIGHGSPNGSASRLATEAQASRVREMAVFDKVETAYLEEPPALADVLKTLSGPVVALLATQGPHARDDIGRLIADDDVADIVYIGATGGDEAIPELILESLGRCCDDLRDQA